jgi:hypothetical protein
MWAIAGAIAIGLGTLFVLGPFILLGIAVLALKIPDLLNPPITPPKGRDYVRSLHRQLLG